MGGDVCGDNRFELIEKYKKCLIECTNIESSPEEMAVLDSILFRFWQMGWLEDLESKKVELGKWIPVSERLPEDGQNVLFCDNDGYIMVGYHIKGRPGTHFSQDGTYEDMKNVRAWMPLPEPYSESKRYAELAKLYSQGVQAGFAESEE